MTRFLRKHAELITAVCVVVSLGLAGLLYYFVSHTG